MEPRSDSDLVEEVRNGKRDAFTALMRRYQERIYWTARRIVGDHAEADDVTQETFVKAFTNLGDFRGDASFYTWLYRIAVNVSLNAVRKRQIVEYLRESDIINRFLPGGDDPHERLEQKDMATSVERAVATLPEKQKAVFVMRYYEELSYEEIAEILKTSVGGLKANYFHALKKVQEYLKHEIQAGTDGDHGR